MCNYVCGKSPHCTKNDILLQIPSNIRVGNIMVRIFAKLNIRISLKNCMKYTLLLQKSIKCDYLSR